MVSSRFSPTKLSISSFSIFISDFLALFTSFIHLASHLGRMEIKDEGSNAISFIRTLLNDTMSVVTYKDVMNRKNQSELFGSLKSAQPRIAKIFQTHTQKGTAGIG